MPKARAAALAGVTRDNIYLYMRYDPGGVFPFRPRGRSQGHGSCWEPGPRVDSRPLGAVRAGSRPVVDQEHLDHRQTKERQRRLAVTQTAPG
jgi:hypothetical protein